ncbi:glycosyltransferase [Methylobacterium sp. NMS12]|uniref:glycosyltransferase n=1 Tax=Methylobacterium sp. NMS12 TaxID=3079766 RepID=UPI003F883D5F
MPYVHGVSVVLATYNGSKFIWKQLDTLVAQTVRPLEIIVSDDASTDDTLKIVRKFATESAVEFKIVENSPALGFRDNFLRASLLARGSLVAFCDQDDIWDTRKIELCSRYLGDRSVSLIAHTAISVDTNDCVIGAFRQGIQRSGLRLPLSYDPWSTFFGFSMVFRRDLLDLCNLDERFVDFIVPSERIAHDRWVMFLAQVVGQTVEIDVPLVRYRQHDDNLFGNGERKRSARLRSVAGALDHYREATKAMITIVEQLPEATAELFPLFNRARAVNFFRSALDQLEKREAIYRTATRLEALQGLSARVAGGTYRAVHNGRPRWRSIAKDLKFALLRR